MSEESVAFRIIFVNHDGKPPEISIKTDVLVSEVKHRILEEHWAEGLVQKDHVQRIRLFAGGKELEDAKTITACALPNNQGVAVPLHVSVVTKEAKGGASADDATGKSGQCFCIIL